MFNLKLKASFDENMLTGTTIIGGGTVISGDINSHGDIRIDGTLNGNLFTKGKVLIGPEGIVQGNIHGKQADILGKVSGNLQVSDLLILKGRAMVDGDIYAAKLQIEPTVIFNGSCHMGANVIELNLEKSHAVVN